MDWETKSHFESIESAHEFVDLLSETVAEVKKEIDADMKKMSDAQSQRRQQALQTVSYKLEKLAVYMKKSRRILNDLRTLRRLLRGGTGCAAVTPKLPDMAKADIPVPPVARDVAGANCPENR
ncbi:MAG: hypothetical protein LAN64_18140 [Acidobacteriia bacterium]|nr:hypothetical protein [Terriglobia bacterium]